MRVNEIIKEKGITRFRIAKMARIETTDIYQCFKGVKKWIPAWRKRISEALEMPEEEVFPEFVKSDNE